MTIAALETILLAPAKTTGGSGIHVSGTLILIIGIVVGIGVLAILGWREGGVRAERLAREAEIEKEKE